MIPSVRWLRGGEAVTGRFRTIEHGRFRYQSGHNWSSMAYMVVALHICENREEQDQLMGVHLSESVYISTAARISGGQVVIEHVVALAVFLFPFPFLLVFFFSFGRKDEEIQKQPGRMNADEKPSGAWRANQTNGVEQLVPSDIIAGEAYCQS
ncbi:hypothetical protein BP00DRAFT_41059 [Aspergillus indologenus CBS 114.80]|uniref:Uncharacterized protein n=1 Tax=Aspergillus indologenus CBS 114.80 TaxID=1450541 RepID=A0A2V5JF20_9EURO|nr:hypothetical protein BP00DRAFT_41059 [Aspergillus indologenus CBS 114.80]